MEKWKWGIENLTRNEMSFTHCFTSSFLVLGGPVFRPQLQFATTFLQLNLQQTKWPPKPKGIGDINGTPSNNVFHENVALYTRGESSPVKLSKSSTLTLGASRLESDFFPNPNPTLSNKERNIKVISIHIYFSHNLKLLKSDRERWRWLKNASLCKRMNIYIYIWFHMATSKAKGYYLLVFGVFIFNIINKFK